MKILMISNTFFPHVGGVANSVSSFANEYRRWGHRVVVVAPEFEGTPEAEEDVIRVPAIQNFNGSDFSVRLPIPGFVNLALDDFQPDIIHSHHPFLLGDTALMLAHSWNLPMVFTHHTMYEQYTHYVPGDSPTLKRFVMELSTGYANLCDMVFAPSESIEAILKKRGVKVETQVIPTGVDAHRFARGDGEGFREKLNIPKDGFLIGHLGRLAPEKNLGFLAESLCRHIKENKRAYFLLAGSGPSELEVRACFEKYSLSNKLFFTSVLTGQELVDAYHAMDAFAFASQTETQGMVLTEALATGTPIVAVDAPGVREVVRDRYNGRLLMNENIEDFSKALFWIADRTPQKVKEMDEAIKVTVEKFSMPQCAARALGHYESLLQKEPVKKEIENSLWDQVLRMIEINWEIWVNRAHAADLAIRDSLPSDDA